MAKIEKLQIQGIRSFGVNPEERQTVEFFSPLTLILGQNGCGKTTIIECLKYITTGDQPPGSKSGASFVHDPKMAREVMVKGQVKLRYKSIDGKDKIATRAMEASQKLKNITVKTLDGSITSRLPDGQNKTVSHKTADLNLELGNDLGVSKPILNYVIFCHQEDSNWPLEEGKKVKDKFDEIFDSAKYKNCLNNIKEVRKANMENAKTMDMNVKHYKSDSELCREKQRDLRKKQKSLEKTEAEVEEHKQDAKPLEKRYESLLEEEKGFAHIQSKITEANTKLECSKDNRDQLRSKISELLDDDITEDEMQDKLASLAGQNKQQEDKLTLIAADVHNMKQKEKSIEIKIQKNAATLGKLNSDRDKHENDLKERDNLRSKAEDSFRISVQSDQLVEALKKQQDKLQQNIDKFRIEREEQECRLGEEIDEVKNEKATFEEKKKRGQQDLVETNRQLAKLKRELADLEGADDQINLIKQQIEAKKEELDKERERFDSDQLQKDIKSGKMEISRLEREEDKIKDELVGLEEQQTVLQKIEYRKKDLTTKEDQRKRIMCKRNSIFLDYFQCIPEHKRLKTTFKLLLDKTENDLKNVRENKERIERQINSKGEINSQLKKEKAVNMRKERELNAKVVNILDCGEDLESEMIKTKDKLDSLRKELQVKEADKFSFANLLRSMDQMKEDPACPLCLVGKTKEEADKLKEEISKRIDDIPKSVQGLQKRVQQEDLRYQELQSISPEYYRSKELKQSIEDNTKKVSNFDKELKQLKEEKESIETEYDKVSEKTEILRSLSDDVHVVDNLTKEISSLQEELSDLHQTCPDIEAGRGLEHVRKELKQVGEQIKTTRKMCEAKQDDFNAHNKRLNELESSYNKLTNKKLEIEGKQQQRANTLEKKVDLEKKQSSAQSEIETSSKSLLPLKEKLESLEVDRSNLKARNNEEMDKLQAKIRDLDNMRREVAKLDKYITSYQNDGKERSLAEVVDMKKTLENEIDRLKNKRVELEEERRQILDDIGNQDRVKRNLEDNIQLKKLTSDINKTSDHVQNLKEKLNTTDFRKVAEKRRQLEQAMQEINADIHSKLGTIAEMKKSVMEIQKELNNPKLKDASRLYFESRVKYETIKLSNDDLNQYYIALDMAITKYHREKMGRVNKCIREIWRDTYRGNDIDFIEIKTDDGEVGGGADKRKNYNYRVVMNKNNIEMDMRGRCSAGQKVLASLIIRLALAQNFSENCGIIALDEPTTNLDKENIESLALALANIAENQAERREFQLVVITHDETFIEHLSRCDKIQYFQKVFRNANGLSIIRRQGIETLEALLD